MVLRDAFRAALSNALYEDQYCDSHDLYALVRRGNTGEWEDGAEKEIREENIGSKERKPKKVENSYGVPPDGVRRV